MSANRNAASTNSNNHSSTKRPTAKEYYKILLNQAVQDGILIIFTDEEEYKQCPAYQNPYEIQWKPHFWCTLCNESFPARSNSVIINHLKWKRKKHYHYAQSVLLSCLRVVTSTIYKGI